MEHIGSIDPGRDKLMTMRNGDPEGQVGTLCRNSYRLFSHEKGKMVRRQRLDSTVRDELHDFSQLSDKVATCQDFGNHPEAQGATAVPRDLSEGVLNAG
jgi:hypothetical protein